MRSFSNHYYCELPFLDFSIPERMLLCADEVISSNAMRDGEQQYGQCTSINFIHTIKGPLFWERASVSHFKIY